MKNPFNQYREKRIERGRRIINDVYVGIFNESKLISVRNQSKYYRPVFTKHIDEVQSSDCRGHRDNTKRSDTGIGLQIPPELKNRL